MNDTEKEFKKEFESLLSKYNACVGIIDSKGMSFESGFKILVKCNPKGDSKHSALFVINT